MGRSAPISKRRRLPQSAGDTSSTVCIGQRGVQPMPLGFARHDRHGLLEAARRPAAASRLPWRPALPRRLPTSMGPVSEPVVEAGAAGHNTRQCRRHSHRDQRSTINASHHVVGPGRHHPAIRVQASMSVWENASGPRLQNRGGQEARVQASRQRRIGENSDDTHQLQHSAANTRP